MLFRIVLITGVFLGISALYLNYKVDYLKNENTSLRNEKNGLKEKIKGLENAIQEYNRAQERAGEKIEKVRTIVRTVKSDCDCYNTLVDSRLLDTIRKN